MKKRTIISIIISIICVIATCNFWCTFEPFNVSFDINGSGNSEVVVYLSKVDSPDFTTTKFNKNTYNLSKTNKIDVNLKRVRYPKRFKITITRLNHPQNNKIQISNIHFRNGLYSIDDLDSFKITGAKDVTITDGILSFVSTQDSVDIYYDKKLNTHAKLNLNLKIFVIVLVLSFLLIYKLTDYLADFSSVKGKSKLDIIYLTLFFIIISLPMVYINPNEESSEENRTLAKLKPFINDKKEINENFGKDFDKWFSDRFFLRDNLIVLSSIIDIINGRINNAFVMSGNNGWLFFKGDNSVSNYQNGDLYSDEELQKISKYLSDINTYCKKHNKKFLLVVPPDKHRIYEEFYPTNLVKKINPNSKSKTNQLFEYLHNNTDINALYLYDILMNAKKTDKELLYYKKDTHWTELGAYYGYKAIINDLNKIVSNDIKIYKPKKQEERIIEIQDLVKLSPKLLQKPDKTVYNAPANYADYSCEIINNDRVRDYYCTSNNPESKYIVTTYHDSFSGALENFYSSSFKKVYYKWRYNAKASELKDSDIVILEINERFLPKLIKLNFEEDK